MKLSHKIVSAAFLVFSMTVVSGCGGGAKFSSVSGIVTYQGNPLKGGTLTFISDSSGTYKCQIVEGGSYSITDIPLDTYGVTIDTDSLNPAHKASLGKGEGDLKDQRSKMNKQYMDAMAQGGADTAKNIYGGTKEQMAKVYTKIPAKYLSRATSGQQIELLTAVTVKNFELTD